MRSAFLRGLLLACLAGPAAAATLSLSPSSTGVRAGDTFAVDVLVADAADLYGYQFDIAFTAPLIESLGVTEGGFLGAAGGPTAFLPGTIENGLGIVSFTAGTRLGPGGVGGSGVLARLAFDAIAPGQAALQLRNVTLLDAALKELPVTTLDGAITIAAVPEPATAGLLAAGGLLVAAAARRRARPPGR